MNNAVLLEPGVRGQPTLRDGFLRSASRWSSAPALTVADRTYSYGELDDLARRWAARLVDAVGRPPRRVGVFGHRSATSYTGVLASLFAGAAFVPLNPTFPLERTRGMVERADLDAVIVDGKAAQQWAGIAGAIGSRLPVLMPDYSVTGHNVFGRRDCSTASPLRDLPAVSGDDLAYLLFTSGSTGVPKGVPIEHRNVVAFLDTNQRRYQLTPADCLSQTFDQTFDLSVFDLFMAWSNGANVCSLRPIELLAPSRVLERNEVTVWFSVPSVAALMRKQGLLKPRSMPTLRWSLFCGEALPRATAEEWQAAAPSSIVENLYGPTELTIACSVYRWDPGRSPTECVQDLVPIGKLYDGLSELIVDGDLSTVSRGVPGELCVSGPQTFPGYWRAPDLTRERVFERIGPDGSVRRYYRTGDIVRSLPSGNYAYLGRMDHQVKVGGHRIELGEIESVLRRAGCIEAAALTWPDAVAPTGIVACVTGVVDVAAVHSFARDYLPKYMVPQSIYVIEAMPLNVNGKIDRAALRAWLAQR